MTPRSTPSRSAVRNQSGAFDLPSILVGVVVVGIMTAGVLAAIFGVIPWTQTRAVKQDLTSVNTAQGVAYAKDGGFQSKVGLVDAGLLSSGLPEDLDIRGADDGECYVAVGVASSGEKFIISNSETSPRELTKRDKWCDGSRIIKDLEPVMISTWDTSLAESCKEITVPVSGLKGTVNWGDGAVDSKTSHTFASTGEVKIRIDGTFAKWGGVWPDVTCLVSVDRWGETGTTDLTNAFYEATNLAHIESIPSTAEDLSYAFAAITSNFTLGNLDTANVTDMQGLFWASTKFNNPVDFDTSKVKSMERMFDSAFAFNQPVPFDTAQVTTMERMFDRAVAFNQPVDFDTSNVVTMERMFNYIRAFNQPVAFKTPRLTNTAEMFARTTVFNQPVSLDTSNVIDMSAMFFAAEAFNQDLSAWDVGKVTDHASFDGGSVWILPKPNWVS